MNNTIIKELNTQLEGVLMGTKAIRELKDKAFSEMLKDELLKILTTLKDHENILILEIESNGRQSTENEGVWGKIIEFFSGIGNTTLDEDREIAHSAYKGVEMAFRATNEFIIEIAGLRPTFRDELLKISDRYVTHIKNLEKLVEDFRN